MDFRTKCHIVRQTWETAMETDSWSSLVEYGNVGFPLAYAIDRGLATITDDGREYVDELYNLILVTLGIEHSDNYAELSDLLTAHYAKV